MSFQPQADEKMLMEEDCSEDKLRSGILVLTNKRLVFQKTEGRIATFSKKEGDVLIDVPLADISAASSEGFLVKKLVVSLKNGVVYKFGVFSIGKWQKKITELKHGPAAS
ncbi:MAG: hypothetical protein ABI361_10105 [Nitrososphaera sp.]